MPEDTNEDTKTDENKPLKEKESSTEDGTESNENDVKKDEKKRRRLILIMAAATVVIIMLLLTLTIILLLVVTVAAAPQCNTSVASVPPVAEQLIGYDSDEQMVPEVSDIPHNSVKEGRIGSAPSKREIEMLDRPQSSTVALGDATTLTCKFSETVQCNWKRNGQPVSIDGRYSYVSKSNTEATRSDCSIRIAKVSSIDLVKWTCELKLTDSDDYEPMDSADVYIFQEKSKDSTSKTEWHPMGSTIELHCRFDDETDCVWLRNESQVSVAGRYRYTNGSGVKAKDCGITISSFNSYDVGTWKCLRPGDSVHPTADVQQVITLQKTI